MTGIPFPDWLHPEVFSISLFGMHFALRWYALAYIVGILLGWRLIVIAIKRPDLWANDTPPMVPAQVENLLTWIVVGVIAGGRLGYVVFYNLSDYLAEPLAILRVWDGGMSFHGGFIGVIVAVFLFARSEKIPLGSLADCIALAAPIGILLGRLANFINAELWGRETDVPWGVIFPGPAAQACNDITTLCARHPSQLYEAALEGLIPLVLFVWLAFRRGAFKTPWLISGLFFALYGVGRFIVEFFRQPDAQFISPGNPLGLAYHIDGIGLTMGQTLTLPMILIGIALIAFARRRI